MDDIQERVGLLLTGERACVEVLVALINGATDYRERDRLMAMCETSITSCVALHRWLVEYGQDPGAAVADAVRTITTLQTYDERLTACAGQQRELASQAADLLAGDRLTASQREMLSHAHDEHLAQAKWCVQRADEFADTRNLVFRGVGLGWALELRDQGLVPVETIDGSLALLPPELAVPVAEEPQPHREEPGFAEEPEMEAVELTVPLQPVLARDGNDSESAPPGEEPPAEVQVAPSLPAPKPRRTAAAAKPATPRAKRATKAADAATAPKRLRAKKAAIAPEEPKPARTRRPPARKVSSDDHSSEHPEG